MMEGNPATVILAAGKGKRMKNPDKSKVMFELNGRPMIEYVVELALKIHSGKIILVVGHQKQSVMDFINARFPGQAYKIKFAYQDVQLGTGHAVMQAEEYLKDFEGNVLILSGDVPLLKETTVRRFIDFHTGSGNDASLISARLDDPHGYGRVLRNERNEFYDIREEKDCNEEEKKCTEINSGIYLINNGMLSDALKTLSTNNAQGEYYLTDVFKYFRDKKYKIDAMPVDDMLEITGINTLEQLTRMDDLAKSLDGSGIPLASS